jgi:hypothetical protein
VLTFDYRYKKKVSVLIKSHDKEGVDVVDVVDVVFGTS